MSNHWDCGSQSYKLEMDMQRPLLLVYICCSFKMFLESLYLLEIPNSASIQGISRLVDITAGGDFLGLCDQKSSYKHVSDFGWLWSYERFLIPVHALVWTTLRNQLAVDILNLLAYRLRCKHYFCHLVAALSIVIIWLELSSTPQSTDVSNVYGQKI